jgi:predicted nucleic acid-binding protein
MNLVDSSVWLAYLAGEDATEHFTEPLSAVDRLLVPAIVVYEVVKVVLRERGEEAALQVYATMNRGRVVAVDGRLATATARLSLQHGLPMADSIILATTRAHQATIWTQDAHFPALPNARYFPKQG